MTKRARIVAALTATAVAAVLLTACGAGSGSSGTDAGTGPAAPAATSVQHAAEPSTHAAAPAPSALTEISEPGTYVVGTDIPRGVWGWGDDKASFPTTEDIKAMTVDGVGPTIYNPYGTAQHVSFDRVPDLTSNGDGAQRTNGRWDVSFILDNGSKVTITAPLSEPLALYSAWPS